MFRAIEKRGDFVMPFTEPNRYWPRPDWKEKLRSTGGIRLRFDSWQAQLFLYWAWRATGRRPLLKAWTDLAMTPEHARMSLLTDQPTPTNDSGMIPPEIFSRVLARSRATSIDPNDNVEDVVLEDPPEYGDGASFSVRARRAPSAPKEAHARKPGTGRGAQSSLGK
jgi:hypothetical protein